MGLRHILRAVFCTCFVPFRFCCVHTSALLSLFSVLLPYIVLVVVFRVSDIVSVGVSGGGTVSVCASGSVSVSGVGRGTSSVSVSGRGSGIV